jgi:hypothetical protein
MAIPMAMETPATMAAINMLTMMCAVIKAVGLVQAGYRRSPLIFNRWLLVTVVNITTVRYQVAVANQAVQE